MFLFYPSIHLSVCPCIHPSKCYYILNRSLQLQKRIRNCIWNTVLVWGSSESNDHVNYLSSIMKSLKHPCNFSQIRLLLSCFVRLFCPYFTCCKPLAESPLFFKNYFLSVMYPVSNRGLLDIPASPYLISCLYFSTDLFKWISINFLL